MEIILTIYINILKYSEDLYKFLFTKNIENKTIFDIAIEKNYISIIKILFSQVENDKNYTDKKNYMNYFKNNIFHKCAEYNNCYLIIFFYEKLKKYYKYFTIEKISNRNYKDQMNPLHIACQKGYKEVLNLLLDLGGDIHSRDINGYTLLIHKDLFQRVGTFSSFRIIQDVELWMKFMLDGVSFCYIPDELNKMRVHPGQVSSNCSEAYQVERKKFNKDLIENYVKKGRMTASNIDSLLYFLYKNHYKESYEEIERFTGKVKYLKKYRLIIYGFVYDFIRLLYQRILKK